MSEQQRFMQRAIDEASKGLGRTRPNPAVGCVVVKDGEIVAPDTTSLRAATMLK